MTGDPSVLALNEASLVTPRGSVWSRVELTIDLRDGEAVFLILDRDVGGDFSVLRLSRVEYLENAILRYRNGGLIEKTRLPTTVTTSGKAVVERRDGGYVFDFGSGLSFEVRDTRRAARFDVAAFPPYDFEIFRRISLDTVTLADGTTLAPRPLRWVLRSTPFVAGIAALLSSLFIGMLWRWGDGRRRTPVSRNAAPGAGPLALAGFFAASLLLKPATRHFAHAVAAGLIVPEPRAGFHIAIGIGYALGLGAYFGVGAMHRLANRRWSGNRAARGGFLLIAYLACAPMMLAVFLALKMFFILELPKPVAFDSGDSITRVILYGGSTTRGHPFGEFDSAKYLQILMRSTLDREAETRNRGADSATIKHIRRRISSEVAHAVPTHVVINSVVNNMGMDRAELESAFSEAVATAQRAGARVLLVHEPRLAFLDPAHPDATWTPVDDVIEAVARRTGAGTLDPHAAFAAHRDEFLFLDDAHLTEYGKLLLARLIAERLRAPDMALPLRGD